MYNGESGVYDGNVEMVTVSEICDVCQYIYFVSEVQITQPPTVMVGQVMSERNESVVFIGELDSGHYEALVPVEGKETSGVFDIRVYRQSVLHRHFL
jgi:hypothetical protein